VTPLRDRVMGVLGPGGALAQNPAWRPRPAQLSMAMSVADCLSQPATLVVEAGTGVGKTLAYLVPLLLSGHRSWVSTATQALQEQLFARDIPALCRAMGLPLRLALLKGRSSYVCLHRLDQARAGTPGQTHRNPALVVALEHIGRWAAVSRAGDLAELPDLTESSVLRPLVSSTAENCLGTGCPRAADCHVFRARREAREADWVIINHHLFFASRRSGQGGPDEILPPAQACVFDEAHRLNEIGVQFLGISLGADQLLALASDIETQGPRWARGLQPWTHLALLLRHAVADIQRLAPGPSAHTGWRGVAPDGVAALPWRSACSAVGRALVLMAQALVHTQEAASELARLVPQAQACVADWSDVIAGANDERGGARWVEWGRPAGWRVVRTPLDASACFESRSAECTAQGPDPRHWIFTSATLGHDESLSWFCAPLGLLGRAQVHTLCLPSPFNHFQQAALFVPDHLPEVSESTHASELAQAVARWATRLGGRTLVLTTTLRATTRMAQAMQAMVHTEAGPPLQLLVQGSMSKRALLERFRAAAQDGVAGAVLVATGSFWEGVDIAGDALQLLVIDKLPFSPPDDPWLEAQSRQLRLQGRSAFTHLHVPKAAMALKQGAGRLIRSEVDKGVLVIADRRLLTRSYGDQLLAALPAMPRLLDEAELLTRLDALVLTRSSTRGC
jgi:ATP-dependent DNA helicase DinG